MFDAPEGPARGAFFFYDSECGSTNSAVGVTPTVAVGEHLGPTVRLLVNKRGRILLHRASRCRLSSRMLMLIEHRTYLSGVIELTLSTSRVHAMLRSSSVMPDLIERSRCGFEF